MTVTSFFNETASTFTVSREQGSDFAKSLAGDFNPLHDADAKRFVVPGDLLFSLSLNKLGISERMQFEFVGMVSADEPFSMVEQKDKVELVSGEKTVTSIKRDGAILKDADLIEAVSLEYVKFSGETFPGILLPLMQQKGVMINPARPVVMYQSMVIELLEFDFTCPHIELSDQKINVDGKRGDVTVYFNILAEGKIVGKGEKNLLLSGLREYEEAAMKTLVVNYEASKAAY